MQRSAHVARRTGETDISLTLNLDNPATTAISTGIGFFDHMLDLFARHGRFGLEITASGDLHVDYHHTVEDVGICLGRAITEAVGDKAGIARYGFFLLPMDEALAEVALDLSGRAYLACNAPFPSPMIGDFPAELVEEFFRAFATQAKMNLHMNVRAGRNAHHVAEALFKATARALRAAVTVEGGGVMSTKGVLE